MKAGRDSFLVAAWLALGLAVSVWSSPSGACADPSPEFEYDATMWALADAPSEGVEAFLDRRYGAGKWSFSDNRVRATAPKPRDDGRKLTIAVNPHYCANRRCDKIELFAIVRFTYIKDGRRHDSGPRIYPMFSVDRWSNRPDRLQVSLNGMPEVTGTVAALRETDGSKTTWHVHRLSEGLRDRAQCGWKEYAESPAWAAFYGYCYIYSRGGFYYDPWPQSDIKSAICKGSGVDERPR